MQAEIPPIPPQSREPNAETIARSQWELANAPMRTSGEFAVAWAQGIPRAVDDPTRDFADERIHRQFIMADSYPVDERGDLIDPIDGNDVDQNLWLLAQLTEPRAIPEVRVTALRTGTRLVNRVIAEASAEHTVREREAAHRRQTEALRERAEHDPLTGLYNRRAWQNQVVNRAEIGRPRAVVVIDCDGFKLVNDVLGHQRGDQVLFELGALFRAHSRDTDIVARMHQPPEVVHAEAPYQGTSESIAARIGGDEFAVALDVTPQDETTAPAPQAAGEASATEAAQGPVETPTGPLPRRRRGAELSPEFRAQRYVERLREVFAEYLAEEQNADLRDIGFELGFSAGVSFWDGETPLSHELLVDLVRQADFAMSADKSRRRRESIWDTKTAREQEEIVGALRLLIAHGIRFDTRTSGVPQEVLTGGLDDD